MATMLFLRPFSVLATRIPILLGWTVDPSSLSQPLLDPSSFKQLEEKATGLLGKKLAYLSSGYVPPKYFPKSSS